MKREMVLGLAGAVLMVSVAWSQDAQPGGRGRGSRFGVGDVNQAVALTAEQKSKVQPLSDKARQDVQDLMTAQRSSDAFQKQRELRQEILAAANAGDDAKVETLQKQLNETETATKRRELASAYYNDVEKVLTPDQKKAFAAWRKLQDSGVPSAALTDPEQLKAGLKKIELSDVQKKQVDGAFSRYEKTVTAAKPGDDQAKKTAAVELGTQVLGALKPSQKVRLAEATMPAGRGNRGQDGGTSQPAAG